MTPARRGPHNRRGGESGQIWLRQPVEIVKHETYYLGYDPGGKRKFAAAAISETNGVLALAKATIVASVSEAITFADEFRGGLAAIAIDAPLTWSTRPEGWRRVDEELRRRHPEHQLKVMSLNSLYGSVAIQGPALALVLARRYPQVVISETHPKMTCAALGIPLGEDHRKRGRDLFRSFQIRGHPPGSDDLVDAAVAACVAWAAHVKPPGWGDLLKQVADPDLIHPLPEGRIVYYFPTRRPTLPAVPS